VPFNADLEFDFAKFSCKRLGLLFGSQTYYCRLSLQLDFRDVLKAAQSCSFGDIVEKVICRVDGCCSCIVIRIQKEEDRVGGAVVSR
jgi:hypothetical protein